LLALICDCDVRAQQAPFGDQRPYQPQKVAAQHLPNAYQIHAKVILGGLPEGDAAFQELAGLSVKTIISVDGATPDVATAKKYGLRYVHLGAGARGAAFAGAFQGAVANGVGPIKARRVSAVSDR
jgi:hypothetical protein